jgi:hypothetical protein
MNTTPLQTFEANVKAKLKESIADLIPQDKLDEMIKASIAEFTTKDLPALIKAELTTQYKAAFAEEFAKPEWRHKWNGVMPEASPALQQMLIDAAPLVLANMIGGAMQSVMGQMQSHLANYPRAY